MPFLISLYPHVKLHVIIMSNTQVFNIFLESLEMLEEEKVELSAVEAMAALGWKKSKVYYWISSGKFQTVERIDGQKIVLTRSELDKLKDNKKVSENFENSEISEEVQESSVQNITELYKTEQNETLSETINLFQNSLNSIEQMQRNYNFSLKLLTDGQSDFKEQYFELKAEKKTVEENLKKSETSNNIKNIIISILLLLLIVGGSLIFFVLNNLEQFENFQNKKPQQQEVTTVENVTKEEIKPEQNINIPVKRHKKTTR